MPFDSGDYETNKEKKRALYKAYYEANKEKERARKKAYREVNKEKERARHKAYYEANKEKILAQKKAYHEANKEKEAARSKAYREAKKEEIAAQRKAYYKANKEEIAAQRKAYYKANKEKKLAQNKAYREANKEKIAAKNKAYYKVNKEKRKERYMCFRARRRARECDLPFNLTEDYLKSIYPSDMICPVLGFEMSMGADETGSNDTSPSLDRIIPEKGYVQGNVIIVSMRANSIKTNARPEEIRKVADFYEKVYEQLDLDFTNES